MIEDYKDKFIPFDKLGISIIFVLLYMGTLNAIGGSKIGTFSLASGIALSILLFVCKIFYYKKLHMFHIYIIALAFLYTLTSLISIRNNAFSISLTNTLQFLACLGIFLYFTTVKWDKNLINRVYVITVFFVLIHFLIWLSKGMPSQFLSIYPNSNLIGAYMFISLFFIGLKIWTSERKSIHFGAAFIALLILLASDTRSIMLALLVTFVLLILWPIVNKSKITSTIFYGLFILSLFVVIFVYPNLPNWKYFDIFESWMLEHTGKSIMSGRSDIWLSVNEYISLKPFLGYGPNVVASDLISKNASTHNLYLNLTLQLGYLGLMILIILLFIIFLNYLKPKANIIIKLSAVFFFGILTHQLFEITLIQNQLSIGLFQWIIIAVGVSETHKFELKYKEGAN
ncbi:O-antigen ligase family protein [Staphylococcus xylosus]|uniref:O-antigen ligase family protein n=1 Tax=Staphylococcus xylosus TaxID=1288 RepID=UPI003F5762C6